MTLREPTPTSGASSLEDVRPERFDPSEIRAQFPSLAAPIGEGGRPLVFLDSAASTLKPKPVIDALAHFYLHDYANIHRGVYALSQRATTAFEAARETARAFLGAEHDSEIVFVRGTTEAINLVASSFGARCEPGDEIVISTMEHHANIVPWQLLAERRGVVLRVLPITDSGELDLDELERALGPRTRLVSVVHVSNALGTVNPAREIVDRAHARGVPVLLDGAQSAPHGPVDVRALGCDFYCFSGHKVYGPSGIGVLYGRREWLEQLPPYQGGGDMIDRVSFDGTTFAPPPARFEAGTPHIAGAVGLAAALRWLDALGRERVAAHEAALLDYALERLEEVPGLRVVGRPRVRAGAISMVHETAHPSDLGTLLDELGVAVRTGHHCAQPLMARLGLPGTARASFGVYNTKDDVDALVDGLARAVRLFG